MGNTAGGFFWSMDGWTGVITMIVAFVLGNMLLALLLPIITARSQSQTIKSRTGSQLYEGR